MYSTLGLGATSEEAICICTSDSYYIFVVLNWREHDACLYNQIPAIILITFGAKLTFYIGSIYRVHCVILQYDLY